MTLHSAVERLLREIGRPMTTQEIADKLNKNNWYQKKDGSQITAFQIHGRTRNYPQLFERNATIVSLAGQEPTRSAKVQTIRKVVIKEKTTRAARLGKDEHYVLDVCDEVLGLTCLRQHRFDFLIGDMNLKGSATKLPVDGYYEQLKLVIEYCERQHREAVKFFDKPDRMTISGVHRGEQRKIYDQRRREILPKHGITLIEFSYLDFNHDRQNRIIRAQKHDIEIVRKKLAPYIDRI